MAVFLLLTGCVGITSLPTYDSVITCNVILGTDWLDGTYRVYAVDNAELQISSSTEASEGRTAVLTLSSDYQDSTGYLCAELIPLPPSEVNTIQKSSQDTFTDGKTITWNLY
jgi:hypothetical protein